MKKLIALSVAFLILGLVCLTQAQVPMTGAGLGKPAASGGSLAIDCGNGCATSNYTASVNTKNYAFTTGVVSNPAIVCIVSRGHASNDVLAGAAATWAGAAMTLVKSEGDGGGNVKGTAIFGKTGSATGTQTFAFSATNVATDNFFVCVSFSGANQANDATAFPNAAGANGSTVGTVNVSSASGHIGVGSYLSTTPLGTAVGTQLYDDSVSGAILNAGADYVTSSGATVTVGASNTVTLLAGVDVSP